MYVSAMQQRIDNILIRQSSVISLLLPVVVVVVLRV